jgi:hypothetical protein
MRYFIILLLTFVGIYFGETAFTKVGEYGDKRFYLTTEWKVSIVKFLS